MGVPTRRGLVSVIPDHGHTKRGDGGILDSDLFAGRLAEIVGSLKRTGLTAAVATANLIVAPRPGSWRLAVYMEATTVTVPGTFTVTIGYTSATGARTQTPINGVSVGAAGDYPGTIIPLEIASGNLTYAVAVGLFTGVYNVRLVPEFLAT